MSFFNLSSPNGLFAPCDIINHDAWLKGEIAAIESAPLRELLRGIFEHLETYVYWPKEALLLWHGCDRIPLPGARGKYHKYPQGLKGSLTSYKEWDTRPNGPAIAAFVVAGGVRPPRFGSSNSWSIHHIYSGKFPYSKERKTLHAAKSGLHFTQSAGLVAVHPIADALCDEFPFVTWHLRAQAFQRFGYDPDHVFGEGHDPFGFVTKRTCRVVHDESSPLVH